MKCPICNAWSDVKETRQKKDHKYRRYECGNLHRFTTREFVVQTKGKSNGNKDLHKPID